MSQSDIEVILYRLSEMDKKIEEVRADQKVAANKTHCPAPGSCLVLSKDIEQLKKSDELREARIRHLESVLDQAKGAGIAAKALWAFIGAGGLTTVYLIMQLIRK
jgi:hypothetical protein